MPRAALLLGSLLLAFAIASCSQEDAWNAVGPDDGLVLAGKGQNNGKGGGGNSNTAVQFSLSGGYDTDPEFQSAFTVADNKNRMQLEGGGGCSDFGCKHMAMTFADEVGACITDPADLDATHVDDLMAQLSDPLQNRTFFADIEKRGKPVSSVHVIYDESGAGSQRYRTQLYGASASQGPTDVFTLTGGTVWILKEGIGSISCPFTGAQVLTVTR